MQRTVLSGVWREEMQCKVAVESRGGQQNKLEASTALKSKARNINKSKISKMLLIRIFLISYF